MQAISIFFFLLRNLRYFSFGEKVESAETLKVVYNVKYQRDLGSCSYLSAIFSNFQSFEISLHDIWYNAGK